MSERSRLIALATLTLAFGLPARSSAQEAVVRVADECAAGDPLLHPLCLEGALALRAARAGVGLAASLGSPVPGSSSTVGRRVGSSPRIAVSARGGLTRVGMPDPRDGSVPAGRRTFMAKTVEASVAMGVLDGFSPLPTVGGMFSIDLLGSIAAVGLPGGSGFAGSVQSLGYGARIGLLRESFTLPGLSVSAARRHVIETRWGLPSDRVNLVFKPTVSSVRVVAGKDLLSFGVMAGWGLDHYGGGSTLTARQTLAGTTRTGTAVRSFNTDSQMFFGSLSYTFFVLQLSGEAGWSKGWALPPGRAAGGYDPGGIAPFGSLAARLTW